jgi:hypothetical protein
LTFLRAEGDERSRRPVMLAVLVLGVGVALVAGLSVARHLGGSGTSDADGDGVPDRVETGGWRTLSGKVFVTDPRDPDSDDDGLTDGEEAGVLVTKPQDGSDASASTETIYGGHSDPRRPDTDDDGLSDSDEADLSLNPLDPDTDDDDLRDGREANVVGTAPDVADTDGDGFEDGFEDANKKS